MSHVARELSTKQPSVSAAQVRSALPSQAVAPAQVSISEQGSTQMGTAPVASQTSLPVVQLVSLLT